MGAGVWEGVWHMFGGSGGLAAQQHIRAELVLDAVTAERYCLNFFFSPSSAFYLPDCPTNLTQDVHVS